MATERQSGVCPGCGGKGEVEVPHPSGWEEYGTIYSECRRCGGTGQAPSGASAMAEHHSQAVGWIHVIDDTAPLAYPEPRPANFGRNQAGELVIGVGVGLRQLAFVLDAAAERELVARFGRTGDGLKRQSGVCPDCGTAAVKDA